MNARVPEKTRVLVTFSCKHSREFPEPAPVKGDHIWCPRCDEVVIVDTALDAFRIRCRTCTYSRRFGAAKIEAEIAAAKHRMSKPGHVVTIFNGRKEERTFGLRDQTVIPMSPDSDQIPF